MNVRYVGPVERLEVVPAGGEPFFADRLQWVDVSAEVAGKRPSGDDLGEGLLAQGDYIDGKFVPLWETEAAKKAQRTRAESAAASGEEE